MAIVGTATGVAAQPGGDPSQGSGLWLTVEALGESEYGPDRFVLARAAGEPGRVPLGHTDTLTTWEHRHLIHQVKAPYSYVGAGEFRGKIGCQSVATSHPVTTLDLRFMLFYHGHQWVSTDLKMELVCAAGDVDFSMPVDLTGVALAAGEELEVALMTPMPNPIVAGVSNLYLAVGDGPANLVAPWTSDALLRPLSLHREWDGSTPMSERLLWATDADAATVILEGTAAKGKIVVSILDPATEDVIETVVLDHDKLADAAPARAFRTGKILDAGDRTRWLIDIDYGQTDTANVTLGIEPLVAPEETTTVQPVTVRPEPAVAQEGVEDVRFDPGEVADADARATPGLGLAAAAAVLAGTVAALSARRR